MPLSRVSSDRWVRGSVYLRLFRVTFRYCGISLREDQCCMDSLREQSLTALHHEDSVETSGGKQEQSG